MRCTWPRRHLCSCTGRRDSEASVMRARDLMTPNPVTLAPQARIAEAWDLMRELEIRHVPVVADGALIGMLSDRDLARLDMGRLLSFETPELVREELTIPIAKVMHPDVIVGGPETGLGEIIYLLLEHNVGA